jgi:hypothetical protein
MESISKAMNERNLIEGQWEDRKQWIYGLWFRASSINTDFINNRHALSID